IMMPPEVLDSLSTRRRATRSCRGRNFMLRCSGVIGIRHQDGNVRVVLSGSTTFALAENIDVPTLSGTDRRRWYYVMSQPVLVVFEAQRFGECGILDGIERDRNCRMFPIDPTSRMPITDLAIAHKPVEALRKPVQAKHSVGDRKRNDVFCGHGAAPLGVSDPEVSWQQGDGPDSRPLWSGSLSACWINRFMQGEAGCARQLRRTIHCDGNQAGGQDDGNNDGRVSDNGLVGHGANSFWCSGKPHAGDAPDLTPATPICQRFCTRPCRFLRSGGHNPCACDRSRASWRM